MCSTPNLERASFAYPRATATKQTQALTLKHLVSTALIPLACYKAVTSTASTITKPNKPQAFFHLCQAIRYVLASAEAMAFKSSELRMTLLGLALVGLLLLSHSAAPVAAENNAGTGKRLNSFSFNSAGGRTLTSFSMNHDAGEGEGHGKAGGGH